jgi:hypothetical protein
VDRRAPSRSAITMNVDVNFPSGQSIHETVVAGLENAGS